jgi:HAD superfamily hydrolase (TIGR01509 family)
VASFDLIIWDCDGCLVDSELISCGLAAELLTGLGYPISATDFIARFAGCGFRDIFRTILAETGVDYAPLYPLEQARALLNERFSATLTPIPGVVDVLHHLQDKPMCIASGSSPPRIAHSLAVTGLDAFFGNRFFSAADVTEGKPAPDLFLHAARAMKADPARCLVIEDSVNGVRAAQAAGMTIFAFLGASHITPAWRARVAALGPDALFDDFAALPALIEAR